MQHNSLYIVLFLLLSILLPGSIVFGQRINFSLYASDGLSLTPVGLGVLDFNEKVNPIMAGDVVAITLSEDQPAVLAIEGRADLDVTLTIDAPASLDLDATNKIPFRLRFAYSNSGLNEASAKTQAREVPAGFNSITLPIRRKALGPPGPPPTPEHQGYTAPVATAYLYIFGTLGPVPMNAAAGQYIGDIHISVVYETYNLP